VDSFAEKAEAEDVASNIVGIAAVLNDLMVATPVPYTHGTYGYPYQYLRTYAPLAPLKNDSDILRDVRDELFWSPFVDLANVSVLVSDGEVTLGGSVDTYAERRAAVENAFEGGAVVVHNEIDVRRTAP
jgi:osmotically-inducible protein OsmY